MTRKLQATQPAVPTREGPPRVPHLVETLEDFVLLVRNRSEMVVDLIISQVIMIFHFLPSTRNAQAPQYSVIRLAVYCSLI